MQSSGILLEEQNCTTTLQVKNKESLQNSLKLKCLTYLLELYLALSTAIVALALHPKIVASSLL